MHLNKREPLKINYEGIDSTFESYGNEIVSITHFHPHSFFFTSKKIIFTRAILTVSVLF